MCQAHICRLTGDHLPGLECLSDGQILPIFFSMDPDTLLSFGRANRRLHRLVSDMQVWRHLLKETERFTHGRLMELTGVVKEFGRTVISSEMMLAEVVKEVASRFKIFLAVDEHGNNYIDCSKKGEDTHWKNFSKVSVSIQGWGAPVTFEMGGEYHLEELKQVARTIGAKFAIKEVKAFLIPSQRQLANDGFKLIAMLVDEQQWRGEEGLRKLEISDVKLCPMMKHLPKQDPLLSLLKASQEWKIETLAIGVAHGPMLKGGFSYLGVEMWRALARAAATGHIGTIKYRVYKGSKQGHKEDVKAVWEITKKMEVTVDEDNPGTLIQIGGGWGEEPKMTWEEAYQTVLHNIC